MRLIDDWLLVTTSQQKATNFYDMMLEGELTSLSHTQYCRDFIVSQVILNMAASYPRTRA